MRYDPLRFRAYSAQSCFLDPRPWGAMQNTFRSGGQSHAGHSVFSSQASLLFNLWNPKPWNTKWTGHSPQLNSEPVVRCPYVLTTAPQFFKYIIIHQIYFPVRNLAKVDKILRKNCWRLIIMVKIFLFICIATSETFGVLTREPCPKMPKSPLLYYLIFIIILFYILQKRTNKKKDRFKWQSRISLMTKTIILYKCSWSTIFSKPIIVSENHSD